MNPTDPHPRHDRAPEGVEFAPGEYAGFWRRAVASLIDLVVLYVLWVFVFSAGFVVANSAGISARMPAAAAMLVAALYVGPLKRSRLRTVGYRVAGVRVVNYRGERPSLAMMLLRNGLYLLGTGFAVVDVVWILGQCPRRKFSDLVAGTYVVKAHARPSGRGEVVLDYYAALGHFWVFSEVRPASSPRGEAA